MEEQLYVHVISHSHWDREWYLPFEKHRVKLVELIDTAMEQFEKGFDSFHLDGQTIVLEDYLSVQPEKKDQLKKYIQEGRFRVGPWYILQDAFLTSGEANVRNLLLGLKQAREWGNPAKVGYFPDTFGNIGQAPQLLQQAGIHNAVFGRGVKPTGFNNMVSENVNYESPYSEMIWQSPDGSEVLGILFANWYCNANEIPVEKEQAKAFWEKTIENARRFAATPHLLMMNGCDHQPIQTDLPEALNVAKDLFPEIKFIHSNFEDYIKAVQESTPENLQVIKGELRSQKTDGWGTLVNTASSRVYLKQMNQRGQTLLEKVAEPLATLASTIGKKYPHHLFTYAWKTLMQNHPHDSICGCSVDEVHREMVTRFEKSRQMAETIIEDSLETVAAKIDTGIFGSYQHAVPFAVFNTTGRTRSGVATVELDLARKYFSEGFSKDALKAIDVDKKTLVDVNGTVLPFEMEDLGIQFGYDLPDNRFRQPYFARRVRLTFKADDVPIIGYRTFALVDGLNRSVQADSLIKDSRVMENEFLRVAFNDDGSYDVFDKRNKRTYTKLGIYENTGDIGNEYMYKQPDGDTALTTEGLKAEIEIVEDTPYRASFQMIHDWEIPARADDRLAQEQNELVWFTNRKAQLSTETTHLQLITHVSLVQGERTLRIKTVVNNTAKDHRLRVLLPTDLETEVHSADSVFEVVKRANEPEPEWKNPSFCHHQQAFVSLKDKTGGVTVANHGLNEYEILRDGRKTVAVTLLRSVGEMGDWGVFPTPEAQCQGEHTAEWALIFFDGEANEFESYRKAYQYQVPWVAKQIQEKRAGELPSEKGLFEWSGEKAALTAVKVSEGTGDVLLRWFNMAPDPEILRIQPGFSCHSPYKSNILEDRQGSLEGQPMTTTARPYEILTLGFKTR